MAQWFDGHDPLIAILRGLEPERALEVGEVLVSAGFGLIEVPLNSPDPFTSIETLVTGLGDRAIVGAGTVLEVEQVARLADIGAALVVAPNCNPAVIERAATRSMVALPGVFTPSEMFVALSAGASGLKIFPAEMMPPSALRAVRAVLPDETGVFVVGGIGADTMPGYLAAGATGFGLGGSIFKPGKSLDAIHSDAGKIVAAYRRATA